MKYHFYLTYEVFEKYQVGEIILLLIHDFQRDFPRNLQHSVEVFGSNYLSECLFQIHKCRSRVT